MRVYGNSATVIPNGQRIVFIVVNLNPIGMTSYGFIHRIIEHFGGKVVQRPIVSTSNEHARTLSDRLQALQDLDCGRIIDLLGGIARADALETHGSASAFFVFVGAI